MKQVFFVIVFISKDHELKKLYKFLQFKFTGRMAKYIVFITIFVFVFDPAFTKPNNYITREQLSSLFQDFKDDLFDRFTLQEKRQEDIY